MSSRTTARNLARGLPTPSTITQGLRARGQDWSYRHDAHSGVIVFRRIADGARIRVHRGYVTSCPDEVVAVLAQAEADPERDASPIAHRHLGRTGVATGALVVL